MFKRMIAVFLVLLLATPVWAAELETGERQTTATEAVQPEPIATEPVQTEPVTTEPLKTEPDIPVMLSIDSVNVYEGMKKAYQDGYVPDVSNGRVKIVLPLVPNGDIYKNQITASLNLGTDASFPFLIANYEKSFQLEGGVFLVVFDIKLSSDRVNGVYPLTIHISGFDQSGNSLDCDYTLFVPITDGKSDTDIEPEPVVYISNRVLAPAVAMAGEEFTLTLTLKNSLENKRVKNMLVTVDTGNMQIELCEDSNTIQIQELAAGGESELTLHLTTDSSIPAGKYTLNFSFQYDSSKTLNLSSTDTVIVEVQQPANMELVLPRFSENVTVGETIPLSLQVLNMGRDEMYNVRCTISGFGFVPSNTGYIGTMAAGSSASADIELYTIALNASEGNEGGDPYGDTVGTITLIYENESGEEFCQEYQFETTVNRPVVEIVQAVTPEEEMAQASGQWWIIILVLGGVILVSGVGIFILRSKKNHCGKYL